MVIDWCASRVVRTAVTLALAWLLFPIGAARAVTETRYQVTWRTASSVPTASGQVMVGVGNKAVLFGGYDPVTGEINDQTWEWDGQRWSQKAPATRPPARRCHAMAALGDKVILFGGRGATGPLGDTWQWDGTNWTKLSPAASPPARGCHAMATYGGKVFLFGGASGTGGVGLMNDTWEWDGTTWTKMAPANAPDPRERHVMATLGDRVVLVAGVHLDSSTDQEVNLQEMWEWRGTDWTHSDAFPSPNGGGQAMAALGSYLVVAGPIYWTWDELMWRQPREPSGPAAYGLYDAALATVGTKLVCLYQGETWLWDGTTWTFVEWAPVMGPGAAMTATGDGVLMFGANLRWTSSTISTWSWDGTAWTPRRSSTLPAARVGHAMADVAGRVFLFGGRDPYDTLAPPLADTWEWDGTTWLERKPAMSPPARSAHAMATLGSSVILFGGAGASGLLDDTWWWNSTTWTEEAASATHPSARAGHAMVALPDQLVLAGPFDSQADHPETWLWKDAEWSRAGTEANEGASAFVMASTAGGLIVRYGESGTFVWNGMAWIAASVVGNAPPIEGSAMASRGTELVLFNQTTTWSGTVQSMTVEIDAGTDAAVDAGSSDGGVSDAGASDVGGAVDAADRDAVSDAPDAGVGVDAHEDGPPVADAAVDAALVDGSDGCGCQVGASPSGAMGGAGVFLLLALLGFFRQARRRDD